MYRQEIDEALRLSCYAAGIGVSRCLNLYQMKVVLFFTTITDRLL